MLNKQSNCSRFPAESVDESFKPRLATSLNQKSCARPVVGGFFDHTGIIRWIWALSYAAVISASSFSIASITSGAFALKVTYSSTSCSSRRREHDAGGLRRHRTRGSVDFFRCRKWNHYFLAGGCSPPARVTTPIVSSTLGHNPS